MKIKILLMLFFVLPVVIFAQETDTTKTNKYGYEKYRFGAYGEILYQHMDYGPDRYNPPEGARADNRSIVDVPRFVLAFDYKFKKGFEFGAELEFEHGGTGAAMELEYDEMGEYEMEVEKGGEVMLEQFHFTKTFSPAFKVRIGHMIVPVGHTNKSHESIRYFGTVRPEGENQIIPLTWHETGIAILGTYKKWSYELQLVNGLDANGFASEHWIKAGHQTMFELTGATSPAFVARIENKSINNLRLAASCYFGGSAKNTAKPENMSDIDGNVSIGSFDFEYNNDKFIARGNFLYGHLGDSYEITQVNRYTSKNIQYTRTPVAEAAITYSMEAGYDILSFFNSDEKLYLFGRYDFYDSMHKVDRIHKDARYKRQVITGGLNYYMLPSLALKLDYSSRIIDGGNFNTENTIGLALVFTGWFINK